MAEYATLKDGNVIEIPAKTVAEGRDAVGAFVAAQNALINPPAKAITPPTEGSK